MVFMGVIEVVKEKTMATLDTGRTLAEATPDLSWRQLYRAGSIAAFLYIVLIVVPIVLVFVAPLPPATGGVAVLQYIAAHKAIYIIELVTFVGLGVPAIIVFLAIAVALKHVSKSYAAVGGILAIASEVAALAYNSSPQSLNSSLIPLSDQYMAATSDAQRLALATAAEGLITMTNAVGGAGILTAVGILILSLVMLKGGFHKSVAFVGIATGAFGIISEALRPIMGLAYSLYGILLLVWFIQVGWGLYHLGLSSIRST